MSPRIQNRASFAPVDGTLVGASAEIELTLAAESLPWRLPEPTLFPGVVRRYCVFRSAR